jgi:hypothetical protein
MRGRRFLLVSAIVGLVVLGGSAIAYAAYPTNSVAVMTGCLTTSGTGSGNIVNVAMGTNPAKACGGNQKQIQLSGGTITRVTAGTGLTTSGSGGTGGSGYIDNGFASLGLLPSFALPQNCTSGQFPDWGGTTWGCGTDQNTTYSGADFATSGQDCPAHQFATGIDANGALKCAKPSLGDLQGSPCTINGNQSTLQVSTDQTTGAVTMTCTRPYLSLSPGDIHCTSSCIYDYDLGGISGGNSTSQTFTVTNSGSAPTGHLGFFGGINGDPASGSWSIANDTCSGTTLGPNGTCTFDVDYTAPAGCSETPYQADTELQYFPGSNLSVKGTYINLHVDTHCP